MSHKGRRQANREILSVLRAMVEAQPDVRFGQLLNNAGVIERELMEDKVVVKDCVHEESTTTLARVAKFLEDRSQS